MNDQKPKSQTFYLHNNAVGLHNNAVGFMAKCDLPLPRIIAS
jgi:hypothetical protein